MTEPLHPALAFDEGFVAALASDRAYLHANPELSLVEYRTADFIEERLGKLGFETIRIADTGVVGVLRNGGGPVIAYRADTDGLPVEEQTGLPFASKATGTLDGAEVPVMHACGHDIHMAVALGTARRLVQTVEHWRGTVLFIFQPAEEVAAGAAKMVEAGLWDIVPVPEIVFGMHVMPYEAGKIFMPVGTAMSMADSWRVTVRGRGAHGSQPEESIDPIVIAASMVLRLQTIVSREVSPRDTAVVTVGTFHAGLKENIIPEMASFSVNVRTFSTDVRSQVLASLRRIVSAEAAAAGAPEPRIEVISEFPECFNEPDEAHRTIADIEAILGPNRALECPPHMASEDFGNLARSIDMPSLFWFLGGTPLSELEGIEPVPVNHSPNFAPPSHPILETGVNAALAAILARLEEKHT